MPYINQDRRNILDPAIDELVHKISELQLDNFDDKNNTQGNLNYIVTRLLVDIYTPLNYQAINDVVGVLECAKLEFYRRAAAPYEGQKIFDNGDVYKGEQ